MSIRLNPLLLCVLAASCGSDDATTTQVVANAAVLGGVSFDLANVASYATALRQPDGSYIGALQVSPIAGGAAQTLDGQATSVSWARGTTLFYLADAQTVAEGTPARPRSYGTLKAWLPAQPEPVELGALVGAFTVSQDGSAVAFIDRGAASSSAPGTVKVWSTSLCTPTCAAPITIADGAASAGSILADDGKHVIVYVPKVGATPPKLVLVTFPDATVTSLSAEPTVHAPMLSPDGATVAWVQGGNQIMSAPTSSPSTTTPITVTLGDPEAPAVPNALRAAGTGQFVAAVKAKGASDASLYLVDAQAATPLGITAPVRFGIVEQTPSDDVVSSRYLFFATATDETTGAQDLWVADLTNPTAAPIQLAHATVGNPGFSDDGTTVRFLDDEDPSTGIGDLYVASLPGGAPVKVATGVRQSAFEPGSTTLVYLGGVDASGVGTLGRYQAGEMPTTGRTIPGVANFQLSRTAPVLYYTQAMGQPTDGVYETDAL